MYKKGIKRFVSGCCALVLSLSSLGIGGIIASAEETTAETQSAEQSTSSGVGATKYIGMTEDFTKISAQPEHRRWSQGCCITGYSRGSQGVCGCRTTTSAKNQKCWAKIVMRPGSQTISAVGCVITSICMMVKESGVLLEANADFNPYDFFSWCTSNGVFNGSSCVNGYNWISKYNANITYKGRFAFSHNGNQEKLVAEVEKHLQDNCLMIGRVNNDKHTVFVLGTGINPETGQKDVIICDPAPKPMEDGQDNFYLHGGYNRCVGHNILRFEVFKINGDNFYVSNGMNISNLQSTDVNAQGMSFGSLSFEDDVMIDVGAVEFGLGTVSGTDKRRLDEITREMSAIKATNFYGYLNLGAKILGVVVLLYLILCFYAYLHDLSGKSLIELLPIITFGNLSAVDNVYDDHTGRIALTPYKAGLYMLGGILGVVVLFNSVPILVWVYVHLGGV